jgi:hypothetical protein
MTEDALMLYSQILSVLSGVLFWVAFLIFGFIARRYKVVFNKETYHGLLMVAPSGILIYSVLMILRSSMFIKQVQLNDMLQVTAYIFLLLSAVLCLIGTIKFGSLIDQLLKYKG